MPSSSSASYTLIGVAFWTFYRKCTRSAAIMPASVVIPIHCSVSCSHLSAGLPLSILPSAFASRTWDIDLTFYFFLHRLSAPIGAQELYEGTSHRPVSDKVRQIKHCFFFLNGPHLTFTSDDLQDAFWAASHILFC